jgi:hypothetical protein
MKAIKQVIMAILTEATGFAPPNPLPNTPDSKD